MGEKANYEAGIVEINCKRQVVHPSARPLTFLFLQPQALCDRRSDGQGEA